MRLKESRLSKCKHASDSAISEAVEQEITTSIAPKIVPFELSAAIHGRDTNQLKGHRVRNANKPTLKLVSIVVDQ